MNIIYIQLSKNPGQVRSGRLLFNYACLGVYRGQVHHPNSREGNINKLTGLDLVK
jgi:hypothetical protein